jgi:hypothetical protein
LRRVTAKGNHGGSITEAAMTLNRLFTAHPRAVGESYVEHMKVALSFAGPMAAGAAAAFVHAFLPFLFVTTTSAIVKRLYARMTNRVPKPPLPAAEALPANGMPVWDPVI